MYSVATFCFFLEQGVITSVQTKVQMKRYYKRQRGYGLPILSNCTGTTRRKRLKKEHLHPIG